MAIATSTALILGGAMIASSALPAMMAPKPQAPPSMNSMNSAALQEAKKAADTSSTSAIKAAKKASGTGSQNTLLTGNTGVGDDELNLGSNLLA